MSRTIFWLAAAAADRRRITQYIARRASSREVAVRFMDGLMGKIDHLSMDTVQYRPGRIDSTREYVVHSNYIVVYRVNEPRERVEILRLLSVWSQP